VKQAVSEEREDLFLPLSEQLINGDLHLKNPQSGCQLSSAFVDFFSHEMNVVRPPSNRPCPLGFPFFSVHHT
jgi:hypothetical protein